MPPLNAIARINFGGAVVQTHWEAHRQLALGDAQHLANILREIEQLGGSIELLLRNMKRVVALGRHCRRLLCIVR